MMTDPALLGPLSLVVSLTGGLIAMLSRHPVHEAREIELREAVDLLRIHCDAMAKLDVDEMPEVLLDFAMRLSALLHDPEQRGSTLAILRSNVDLGEGPSPKGVEESHSMRSEYDRLLVARPDLATAFIQSIVSGIMAFEKRWPDCAGVLSTHLSRVVAAPIEEAERIVWVAGRPRPQWPASHIGAAAA